ncbi:MAG: hypothetical protein WCG96_03935 [Actinomycetes bacterium]
MRMINDGIGIFGDITVHVLAGKVTISAPPCGGRASGALVFTDWTSSTRTAARDNAAMVVRGISVRSTMPSDR